MLVIKSSIYDVDADTFFSELKKSKSHTFVSKPLVCFKELENSPLPKIWKDEKVPVMMKLFGFIPFDKQWIVISVDDKSRHIRDNGYSKFIKRWNHNIYVQSTYDNKTLYTDAVEIEAGFFTFSVYLFAIWFYSNRQRRWHKYIKRGFQD